MILSFFLKRKIEPGVFIFIQIALKYCNVKNRSVAMLES
jgi:hypothetical protein